MIMTEFGLEKRRRLRDRYVSNSIEREQMIFEQILRTILDEDLTRYDVADWIWVIYESYNMICLPLPFFLIIRFNFIQRNIL